MSEQAERRVGTIIGGKWRVDALLGSGSMAAVYAVTHRNGARAALKILHPTLCTDPAVCERFLGEGYLANSVKHAGIVRVLDDGVTDDGCVFLTMDLLEGDTLEALRQKRGNKIPIEEALDLADKLMDVLAAVHTAAIIHRDLKPQNVFVCNDGVVKLLDFGVARVFDRTSQSKLSMFGLVLGTPSFMSPEQALGSRDKVDHRSDIWSFGATIFTALTGETVHLGANVQAKLLAAATVKARSIGMVMPSLPPGIGAAIDMALRFKKEDRWQSVEVMRRSFREAREVAGLGRLDPSGQPARGFDMSLDESTHVDRGALVGAVTKKFDGDKTQPFGGAHSDPPKQGPGGTFIGSPGKDVPAPPGFSQSPRSSPPRSGPKSNAPPLPARASSTPGALTPGPGSFPPNPIPSFGPPAHTPLGLSPAAVVRRLPTPAAGLRTPTGDPGGISARGSRADGQEGSIPAYGNTLNFGADDSTSEIDPRDLGGTTRKGNVAIWLMAVLLAAAALGGIAFFAVKRGPLSDPGGGAGPDRGTTAPPVPSATAIPPQPTSMTPSTAVTAPMGAPLGTGPSGADTASAAAKDAAVGVPTPPATKPTPPVRPLIARPSGGHGPRTPSRPTANNGDPPTNTGDPPKPALAPDPFGTPE